MQHQDPKKDSKKESIPTQTVESIMLPESLGCILAIASPEILEKLQDEEKATFIITLILALKTSQNPTANPAEKKLAEMRAHGRGYLLGKEYPKGLKVDLITKNSDNSGSLDRLDLESNMLNLTTYKISDLRHSTLYSKFTTRTSAATSTTLSSTVTASSTSSASSSTSSSSSSPGVDAENETSDVMQRLRLG